MIFKEVSQDAVTKHLWRLQVPLDPQLSCAAEEGRSAFDADKAGVPAGIASGALPALRSVIDAILAAVGEPPSLPCQQ